ncbi:MAG TPA: sigma-70 family RNA polymerase sigma factor [Pseudonocardiaceae bacterium]|jgi:RNA polymerase sigma factor (sigma-70 family)|nr:sigma-70 family RNA polymerase sigma factor [Pseudonocardiaceae bacterium]
MDRIDDPLVPGELVRGIADADGCIDDVGPLLSPTAERKPPVNGVNGARGHVADTQFLDADDGELLRRVRGGQDAAFAELFSRHAAVARSYAMRYANDVAEAEDIAAEAFFRVLQAVRRGSGPDDNVRGYLLTVIRRLAAEWRTRRRDVPVSDEELGRRVDPDADQAGTRAEAHLIARAFTSLPQRWRRVLWQVEVEGERPAVVAPAFGLSPNATAALARRAREGLRAAYLQAHVPSAKASSACQAVIDKLGAYTAGLVRGSEARRIVAHLAGCASCRSVHAELADVCAGLRRYAGALPLPIMAPIASHQPSLAATAQAGKAAALAGKATAGKAAAASVTVGKAAAGKAAAGKAAAGGKMTALGKAAAFGIRFKLAVATMSVVVVGGLGITAGPLLLKLTGHLDADRGTVQQLPVIPNALTSGSAGVGVRPFGPDAQRSTGTAITGPRADQNRPAASDPAGMPSRNSAGAPGQAGGQNTGRSGSTSGNKAQGSGVTSASVQDLNPGQTRTSQADSPNGVTRNALTPTVTPTVDPATATGQGNPTVWSTEYTTDGTTVWITKWVWTWQNGAAPPGK